MNKTEQGWQVGKSLSQCLSLMLEQQMDCDVTFRFKDPEGNSQILSAHKLVLKARSPVFEAMFSGRFAESNDMVTIKDLRMSVFKDLLRYTYTDSVELTEPKHVVELLYGAKKYLLDELEMKCFNFLERIMNEENVCTVLSSSLYYNIETVVEKCLNFISSRVQKVCQTEAFKNMPQEALQTFLKSDKLYNGYEVEVYQACIRWAKRDKACDEEVRFILGNCLHQIRFCTMSAESFATNVASGHILKAEEKVMFYDMLLNPQGQGHQGLSRMGFNTSPRLSVCQIYETLSGERTIARDDKSTFTFSANKPIQLCGFTVFPGPKDSLSEVNIEVSKGEQRLALITAKIFSDGDMIPAPAYLDGRIDVPAVCPLQVQYTVTGKTGFASTRQSLVTVGQVTFNIKHELKGFQSNYYGQVPQILYIV